MFNFSNMAEIVTYSLSRTRFTGIYHLQCDHNFVLEKTCQVGKKNAFWLSRYDYHYQTSQNQFVRIYVYILQFEKYVIHPLE